VSHLLDTNICIALLKGTDQAAVGRLRAADPAQVFLCSVVKAELLYGARKSQQVESNLALLGKFFGPFESLPFDDRCAELYGMTRALLAKARDLLADVLSRTMIVEDEEAVSAIELEIDAWHNLAKTDHHLGDTARVPYGTKSGEVVRRYAMNCSRFLVELGAKMLVVACNTASS